MKRIVIFLLMVCVSVASVASVWARGGAERGSPKTLSYFTSATGVIPQELLDNFEAESGVRVAVSVLDPAELLDRVAVAGAGGDSPADIISIDINDFAALGYANALMPLDSLLPAGTFAMLFGEESFKIDDAIYALPLNRQTAMLEYNNDLLGSIGLSGEDMGTWADIEQAAVALKEAGLEYPLAFEVDHITWYLMALSLGSTLFDNNAEPLFDNPSDPGFPAFQQLIRYFEEGLISPARITSPGTSGAAFLSGEAAFHIALQGSGSLARANDPERSAIAPNADYLLLPDQHYSWNLPAGIGIAAHTPYPEAARMFLEFITSDTSQKYLYETTGAIPSRSSSFEDLGSSGKINGYATMRMQAEYLASLPYNSPWFAAFGNEAHAAIIRAAMNYVSSDRAIPALAAFQRVERRKYE